MTLKALCLYWPIVLTCASPVSGQSNFQNLNFEKTRVADLPPGQFEFVSVSDALRVWTARLGTDSAPLIQHNGMNFGDANISIFGPQSPITAPEGNYFVLLQAGHQPGAPAGVLADASIAQVGTVPLFAQSIHFISNPNLGGLEVSFGGQSIPLVRLGFQSGYGLWAGDLSAFAGRTDELRFTAQNNNWNYLDDITFSPVPVPEPSILALGVIGAALLRWSTLRRRRVL